MQPTERSTMVRAKIQMVGVSQDDLRADFLNLAGLHAFDGYCRSHRHKDRRLNHSVRRHQTTATRRRSNLSPPLQNQKAASFVQSIFIAYCFLYPSFPLPRLFGKKQRFGCAAAPPFWQEVNLPHGRTRTYWHASRLFLDPKGLARGRIRCAVCRTRHPHFRKRVAFPLARRRCFRFARKFFPKRLPAPKNSNPSRWKPICACARRWFNEGPHFALFLMPLLLRKPSNPSSPPLSRAQALTLFSFLARYLEQYESLKYARDTNRSTTNLCKSITLKVRWMRLDLFTSFVLIAQPKHAQAP